MKQLKYLLLILPFLFIGSVKADELEIIHSNSVSPLCSFYYSDFNYIKDLGYDDEIQRIYNMLLEEYNINYSSDYPYFYVDIVVQDEKNCNTTSDVTDKISYIHGFLNFYSEVPVFTGRLSHSSKVLYSYYYVPSTTYYTPQITGSYSYSDLIEDNKYNPMAYFISNFDLFNDTIDTYKITGNSNFTINPGDIIKPMFSADSPFDNNNNYVEINLNSYDYVVLSFKDYDQKYLNSIFYENDGKFISNFYVKGNFCLTPVYNYGMTERKDILEGTQVERCSPYYEYYTPVRTYISLNDTENNAVYYLKAYDTSKDNYVKIDTSIFDITYITEENRDNPSVLINGRSYPIFPYDSLTDTATKSEDEGYVSGAVEEFSFTDIFTAPLEALKDIWSAVISFFAMITEFLALLPAPLQGFLYTSFTLAIVLGLIKILL